MKRKFFILVFLVFGLLFIRICPALGNWQYGESEAETTTTSTSWVTKVSLISNSGGYHLMLAGWEMGNSGDTSYALTRVLWNASVVDDFSMETFDGTNRYRTFAVHSILNLAAGDSIKIQYGTNNSSFATRIKRARILLIPLSGVEYNTGTGLGVINLGTSWSNVATVTITPATAGDYLIVGSLGLKPNSTTTSGEARIELDGASTWDLVTMEGKDVSDKIGYLSTRVLNLNATSHTIRLQARSDEGTATDITKPRISVIRLTKTFNDFSQTEQTDEDTTTNGGDNWVNRVTHLPTPKNAGSYLVLCHSLLKSIPDTLVIPEHRWTENGVEQNKFFDVLNDSTDYLPNIGFRVFSWDATQKTLGIDFTKSTSGTEPVYIKDARLITLSEELYTGAPVLDSIGPKNVNEGSNLTFRIHATDADLDSLVLTATNLPANSSFTDSGNGAGSFSFDPDYTQAGIYNVTIIVTDTVGLADSEVVQITVNNVNRAPALDSIGPKSVSEGSNLTFRIHATDADLDSLVLTATNLPANSSFTDSGNGVGSFSFNPGYTQAGICNVTFIATDTVGLADSEVVQITVNNVNRAPVLDSIGPKSVSEGSNLTFRVHATDADLDSIILDTLSVPLNATFIDSGNGAGSFVFTPDFTQADTYYVTFIASDGGLADSEVVEIVVTEFGNHAPVLDSIGPKTVTEGDTLEFRIDATDADLDSIILDTLSVPSNATFIDSGNGAGSFTFDPDYTQAGIYNVTFIASDGSLADSEVIAITVNDVNHSPVLDSIGPQSVDEGSNLTFRIHATDADLDSIILDTLNVPLNATFIDSGNGAGSFTFDPDYTQAGIYNVTFIAIDTLGLADSEVVQITVNNVNRAPVLDSIGPKSADEGSNLTFRIHATDADLDSLVLTATNLPANSSFTDSGNGAGSFSFNPSYTQAGIYNVTFKATDPSLAVDSEVVQITVNNVNQAPVLSSIGPHTVVERDTLRFRVTASDPDGDSLVLNAINLPTHASFLDSGNRRGSFTFAPDTTQAGIYYVTFIARDTSLADSEIVTITVTEWHNRPPVLDSIGPKTVLEGDSLKFVVTASDSDGAIPLLAASNLPANATFRDSGNGHGLFKFKPTFYQAGKCTVTFTAIDISFPPPLSDFEKVVITIIDVNRPPAIDSIGPKNVRAGSTLNIRVVGRDPTDADGGPLLMTAIGLPEHSTFHDSGGGVAKFTFTPDYSQVGVDTVIFFCTDEGTPPMSGYERVIITVTSGPNRAPVLDPIGGYKSVREGDTLRFRIHATDPDGNNPFLYTSLPRPRNATFADSGNGSGSFTFTPDYMQSGLYEVTFYASDGDLYDYEEVLIQVIEAGNQRPILDSIGPKSVTEGDTLIFVVSAVDPDSTIPRLRVDSLTLPIGASFTDSLNGRGLFKFHPSYFQADTYYVIFIARDSIGLADSERVEITVIDAGNQTPVLDSIGPKQLKERKRLDFDVRASDADSTTPRLRASNLPPGDYVSFTDHGNGTGSFSYRPGFNSEGVYYTVFEAVDSVDTLVVDSEVVTITVLDSNRHPEIAIDPNLLYFEVNEGDSVMFLVKGTDPDSVITSVHVDSLPTNATFRDSGNGVGVCIFHPDYTQGGTPFAIYKVYPYVVDGRYPDTAKIDPPLEFRVSNVPVAPVIVPINDTSIMEGQTLKIRVKATHPVGPPTLKAINLPTNATFKDSGGGIGGFVFTASYTQAGVYGVTFIATKEKADSEFVQITVIEAGNQPPVLAPLIDSTAVCIGDTFKLHPRATDPDGPNLTLSASPLPTNSDFHDSGNGGGLFRFHPDSTQKDSVYHVTFIASDGFLADSETVAMRVTSFVRGDVNRDGVINISDVVYLINYLYVGGPPPTPREAGDANADGFINVSDVVYLINYLYVGGPPPPGKR
jgi:hypothetical protein